MLLKIQTFLRQVSKLKGESLATRDSNGKIINAVQINALGL